MNITEFIKNRLAPFKYRQFSIFYFAQMISLIGNWMMELAKSWIVINIMGTSSAIGALLFAAAVPNLILVSFGGMLADRKSIQKILVVTQFLLAISAFAFGALILKLQVEYWHLIVFAVLEGVITAFDMPAFTKVIPSLIPPKDLQQAFVINSMSFHLSRVVGPTIAGLMMGFAGPGGVAIMNGVSFLAVLLVFYRMKFPIRMEPAREGKQSMVDAIKYLRNDPLMARLVLKIFFITALLFPLVFTTFRIYLQKKFSLNSQQFGLTFAVPGIGALCGSLTFLLWSPKNPLRALPFGLAGLFIFLIGLSYVDNFYLALVCLVFFSFSMYLSIASANVTLQMKLDNHVRGRVGALVGTFFISVAPIMSVPISYMSDKLGAVYSMRIIAVVFTIIAFFLYREGDLNMSRRKVIHVEKL